MKFFLRKKAGDAYGGLRHAFGKKNVEGLAAGSVEIKVDILEVLYYIIGIEHLFAWRIT